MSQTVHLAIDTAGANTLSVISLFSKCFLRFPFGSMRPPMLQCNGGCHHKQKFHLRILVVLFAQRGSKDQFESRKVLATFERSLLLSPKSTEHSEHRNGRRCGRGTLGNGQYPYLLRTSFGLAPQACAEEDTSGQGQARNDQAAPSVGFVMR